MVGQRLLNKIRIRNKKVQETLKSMYIWIQNNNGEKFKKSGGSQKILGNKNFEYLKKTRNSCKI